MALEHISELFLKHFPYSELKGQLDQQNRVRINQLVGSTPSLLLQRLSESYKHIVAVYPDAESAEFLQGDLHELNVQNPLYFPPTHHKPYDENQVVDTNVMVQRSEVLEKIIDFDQYVISTSANALFEKIASSEAFNESSLLVENRDEIRPEDLTDKLSGQGYQSVKFVERPGEYATRGGIIDVFPYSSEYPVRIEFFGDEIDSIREFDADSQRSISYLNAARFVPDIQDFGDENNESLLHYLEDDTVVLLFNYSLIQSELEEHFEKAQKAYKNLDKTDQHSVPAQAFLSSAEFRETIDQQPQIYLGSFSQEVSIDWSYKVEANPQPEFNASFKLLRQNIKKLSKQNYDIFILSDNEGQRDRFEELLGEHGPENRYHLSIESLHQGFILKEPGIAVYTDHQIFNRYHRPKVRRRKSRGGISLKELRDLNVGDFVVHVDYGIGKFRGFRKIEVRGIEQESVVLEYKEGSILYVNVSNLHKLQKYSGKEGTQPKITKLGSGEWARKKAKTKKRVKDIARDLIELYAKRKARKAYRFSPDTSWQTELEARFEFEETPDQQSAIDAVKQDMESDTPMDRLICGDVGFGKTEVAVRAAFKAVMDHKQVGILVPTTILADQHYQTFKKRMENFPVEVEVLSRFRSRSEQKDIIERTKNGKVDILIGTHRITSKDVDFNELGLLVVDEEQRFGVSAKEKLKEYRATIDVLTLTATPIPRTLQFSLMGARDLSIISTPPPNRQPVYTEIHSFDEDLIRDAIMHELSRGGQVFFIHNRVKNIEEVSSMIRQLVPDVRVRYAHGQMSSRKLEKIIHDFYQNKFDVLVSTNIVENGIDISNANTMLINRADHFGLAELHQLRGRVGRSNRKAYCYLITRPIQKLSPEARQRLMALEEFSDLGSGFNIAMRDLDIRGAGDLLGAEQSGFINDLGFQMYTRILNDAVKELKEEEFDDIFDEVEVDTELPETQVEFDRPALLGNDYVSDNVERLNLYRKLAEATSVEEIEDWKDEIEDRFGPLPDEAQNLMTAARIKLFAARNFITKVRIRSDRMWLFCPKSDTELGETFYQNGYFQAILKRLQEYGEEKYKLIQKKNEVRFVIYSIPDIHDARDFLQDLQKSKGKKNRQPPSSWLVSP